MTCLFSAMTSEPDENGEKHVLLCRVILGNVAMVKPGTFPPNVDFDTGVDNIENPTWYVVKWANMNTHILPQCIVSYKSSDNASGEHVYIRLLILQKYLHNFLEANISGCRC